MQQQGTCLSITLGTVVSCLTLFGYPYKATQSNFNILALFELKKVNTDFLTLVYICLFLFIFLYIATQSTCDQWKMILQAFEFTQVCYKEIQIFWMTWDMFYNIWYYLYIYIRQLSQFSTDLNEITWSMASINWRIICKELYMYLILFVCLYKAT